MAGTNSTPSGTPKVARPADGMANAFLIVMLGLSEVFTLLAGHWLVAILVPLVGTSGGLVVLALVRAAGRRRAAECNTPGTGPPCGPPPQGGLAAAASHPGPPAAPTSAAVRGTVDSHDDGWAVRTASAVGDWVGFASLSIAMPTGFGALAVGTATPTGQALAALHACAVAGLTVSLVADAGAGRWRRGSG